MWSINKFLRLEKAIALSYRHLKVKTIILMHILLFTLNFYIKNVNLVPLTQARFLFY